MNSRLSWPVRITLCIGALGLAYAVAEDLVPGLRPSPPKSAIGACEKFQAGMDMPQAREVAAKNQLRMSEALDAALVRVEGSCQCALDLGNGRIQRNRVVCEHDHRILFGGGA